MNAELVEIRPARSEDFNGVLELLRQLWPEGKLDESRLRPIFERALNSETQAYRCAINTKQVVGFASLNLKNRLWAEGSLAWVDEIVVDASYRGQGIGTRLLAELEKVALQNNCARLELDSSFHRTSAHQFYERRGFERRAALFSKRILPR
jgi:GNAT superfamily N-acetyltransferase